MFKTTECENRLSLRTSPGRERCLKVTAVGKYSTSSTEVQNTTRRRWDTFSVKLASSGSEIGNCVWFWRSFAVLTTLSARPDCKTTGRKVSAIASRQEEPNDNKAALQCPTPKWSLMTPPADPLDTTWLHWGGFARGYLSCSDPGRGAVTERRRPPPSTGHPRWERRAPARSGRSPRLRPGPGGRGMSSAAAAAQDSMWLRRRKRKISSLTARLRSCFSSSSLRTSGTVSTGCSSSTQTWSGEAGSSTWPPVTR